MPSDVDKAAVTVVTRFAPSPTGDLHLGHAFAAAFAHDAARRAGGRFLVRIEDIDRGRCRNAFVDRNLEDLRWLGLGWEEPVWRQSQRLAAYGAALDALAAQGVTYRCVCTRAEVQAEIAAAGGAPHPRGDAAAVYPGTCRVRDPGAVAARIDAGAAFAIRLDAARALALAGAIEWTDIVRGRQPVRPDRLGDVVIARKDLATSYHLAVVVDDAAQGVTHVTRGDDLFDSTHVHRLLYALLGLPPPAWHHHPLCRDESGRRLAKRDRDLAIRALRARGLTPSEVLAMAAQSTAAKA